MRRSNPNPVLLTSKSFTSSGAGVPCYAFSFENQRVIKSCYTRYNVALRFSCLNSICYRRVLQNGISRAYMCGCGQVRAYTRAPVRVHSCYIATSRLKSLKKNRKSVAGPCSRCVVCSCYGERIKYSGFIRRERTERDGRPERERTDRDGRRNGRSKWRISAVFGALFGGMFNAPMFNVCGKWRFPAVFRAVRTFFLKMFTGAETVPGGSPQNGRIDRRYIRSGFFFDFRTGFRFDGQKGGAVIFSWAFGV